MQVNEGDEMAIQEHYVPQFYLRQFSTNDKKTKINVFDKRTRLVRLNQTIKKVACERHFYDIDWNNNEVIEYYGKQLGEKYSFDNQVLEKIFDTKIESPMSKIVTDLDSMISIDSIIGKRISWLNQKNKDIIAPFIATQYIRSKESSITTNQLFTVVGDSIKNMMIGKEYSQQVTDIIESVPIYRENKSLQNIITLEMVEKELTNKEITSVLLNYIYAIGYNDSDHNFVTSDNPIAIYIPGEGRSGGILSKKSIITYPLSPRLVLILFEKSNFKKGVSWVSNRVILLNESIIDAMNSLQFASSYSSVFSKSSDFDFAHKMMDSIPLDFDILNYPRITSNQISKKD